MRKTKLQFGGGMVHPKVANHLARKPESSNNKAAPKTQFGGGVIHPKVKAHQCASANAKIQFGGGIVHPKVANQRRLASK